MDYSCCRSLYFWIYNCFLFIGVSSNGKQNIYSSGCSNTRITLECPDYHKIAIKRLFYGVKNDTRCAGKGGAHSPDCCQPTHNDCPVVDDMNDMKYPSLNMLCSGHRGCDIEAESIQSGMSCRANGYGDATDYMSVIHDCIPDEDISTLCSNSYKRGRLLYLSNANYPGPISGGKKQCQCLIKTGSEVGLDLHALDIIITRSEVGNHCYQDIQIKDEDGYQKEITCGHAGLYGFRNIYNRDVRTVTVTLNSRARKEQGYVWLQAKASGKSDYVEVYCGNEMRKYLGLTREEQESRTVPPKTVDGSVVTGGPTNGTAPHTPNIISDMAALIAGIAVAMALVIIIGLIGIIILCVRRRQEKRQQQQAQRSFPSPSLKSKEDHTSNSYCKYDYDEDKYCSIKRSPMRMTKFGNFEADQKLKEAFLQGVNHLEPPNQNMYVNYQQELSTNQVSPFLEKTDEIDSDKSELIIPKSEFIKVGKTQPRTIREITMSTLPEKRKGGKNKTVTFSPVAMVTPLPSGSEESVPEDYLLDEIKASIIDGYSKTLPLKSSPRLLHGPEKPPHLIVNPRSQDDSCIKLKSMDDSGLTTFQSPGCENVTEEDLWKAFHIKLGNKGPPTPPPPEPSETPTDMVTIDTEDPDYDENPYDNIPYMNTGSLRRHNAPDFIHKTVENPEVPQNNLKLKVYKENPNDIYRRIISLKPMVEPIPESV